MSEGTFDLQSRSVWQLMASYGIGSWITLQVADTLSSLIGLPLWFGRALLVALLAGFVVLVATSLVQRRARPGGAAGLASILTWKNWRRGGVAAGALVLLLTVGYLALRSSGIGPVGTLQARGVFEEQERVILADFGGDVEPEGLTGTVTTLLRIDLAQSPAFTVLEPVQLVPVLSRMQRDPNAPLAFETALEAARREGIKAVVAGEVLQAGSSYVVSARIVSAAGEPLVAVRETVDDVSEIPDGVDRLSAQLRERIGESLRTIQGDAPLDEVTTASMQALEKYAQSDRANNRGDIDRAIVLMEEALAEDSLFAMAHRKLGILLNNLNAEPERAQQSFTRAYELRDRLTDRERWLAEAAYLDYVEGDNDAAESRYVTLLEAYPTDRIALNNLAVRYRANGRTAEAADVYLRSVRQGGAPASTYSGAIDALIELGRVSEAEATLRDFEETFPDNPNGDEYRLRLAAVRLDYLEAQEAAERMAARVRGSPFEGPALATLANILFLRGQVDDAWDAFDDGFARFVEAGIDVGASYEAIRTLLGGVVVLSYEEDPERAAEFIAAEYASTLSAQPVEDRMDTPLAEVLAGAGRPDLARTLLDAYARDTDQEDYEDDITWRLATARIDVAEGRVDEALDSMRDVHETTPCLLCGLLALGQTFAALEQPDSAIHYLEKYVTAPDPNRLNSGDNSSFWAAVPLLAELPAEHGDASRARELLTLFLEITEGADPEYQPKRERLRALLQSLG